MGKIRLLKIRTEQGQNETNLNPNSSALQYYNKAQKYAVKKVHEQTLINRRIRRITKKIKKIQEKDYIRARRILFGYWFYWFREGKIGPEEESNEPNLVRKPYSEEDIATLFKRWGIHG